MSTVQPLLEKGNMLGEGFFSRVYLGQDAVRGKVAIKVLRQINDEPDEEWQARKARILYEGQRLRDAEHDHVVRIFYAHYNEELDVVELVLEFCDGGSAESLYKSGPTSLKTVRTILSDVALGLQAVHSREMLHRDLKPGNIMLTKNRRAKLSDFGLATDNLLLGYGLGEGYADHIAPEVYISGLASIKTDIWAFGMTAYRLMHGHSFYQTLPSEPQCMIPQGGFSKRLPWLPHIPVEWRKFIEKTLHDNPYKRHQSAIEILQHIATLPVDPNWTCSYEHGNVCWERLFNGRRIAVTWEWQSETKHQWIATSYPTGKGMTRRINGSQGIIPGPQALQELELFFATSRARS